MATQWPLVRAGLIARDGDTGIGGSGGKIAHSWLRSVTTHAINLAAHSPASEQQQQWSALSAV